MVLTGDCDKRKSMISAGKNIVMQNRVLQFIISQLLFLAFFGCASVQDKSGVLALVDGDPLVRADLEYAIQFSG